MASVRARPRAVCRICVLFFRVREPQGRHANRMECQGADLPGRIAFPQGQTQAAVVVQDGPGRIDDAETAHHRPAQIHAERRFRGRADARPPACGRQICHRRSSNSSSRGSFPRGRRRSSSLRIASNSRMPSSICPLVNRWVAASRRSSLASWGAAWAEAWR